jgi:hypothetical protein
MAALGMAVLVPPVSKMSEPSPRPTGDSTALICRSATVSRNGVVVHDVKHEHPSARTREVRCGCTYLALDRVHRSKKKQKPKETRLSQPRQANELETGEEGRMNCVTGIGGARTDHVDDAPDGRELVGAPYREGGVDGLHGHERARDAADTCPAHHAGLRRQSDQPAGDRAQERAHCHETTIKSFNQIITRREQHQASRRKELTRREDAGDEAVCEALGGQGACAAEEMASVAERDGEPVRAVSSMPAARSWETWDRGARRRIGGVGI